MEQDYMNLVLGLKDNLTSIASHEITIEKLENDMIEPGADIVNINEEITSYRGDISKWENEISGDMESVLKNESLLQDIAKCEADIEMLDEEMYEPDADHVLINEQKEAIRRDIEEKKGQLISDKSIAEWKEELNARIARGERDIELLEDEMFEPDADNVSLNAQMEAIRKDVNVWKQQLSAIDLVYERINNKSQNINRISKQPVKEEKIEPVKLETTKEADSEKEVEEVQEKEVQKQVEEVLKKEVKEEIANGSEAGVVRKTRNFAESFGSNSKGKKSIWTKIKEMLEKAWRVIKNTAIKVGNSIKNRLPKGKTTPLLNDTNVQPAEVERVNFDKGSELTNENVINDINIDIDIPGVKQTEEVSNDFKERIDLKNDKKVMSDIDNVLLSHSENSINENNNDDKIRKEKIENIKMKKDRGEIE